MSGNLPTDPYAMVRPNSKEAESLLCLGWTVTDLYSGWLHLEPPNTPAF